MYPVQRSNHNNPAWCQQRMSSRQDAYATVGNHKKRGHQNKTHDHSHEVHSHDHEHKNIEEENGTNKDLTK